MIKVALTCAALLIAFAGVRPASAECWSCCDGRTSGGHCISLCPGVCPGHQQMVRMKTTPQCDPQYQTLSCSGPKCTWMCSRSTH
jgi:hypothetical protein